MTEKYVPSKLFDRLLDLLRRHVTEDDLILTDDAFVMAVLARYLADRESYLLDPNE